MHLFVFGGGELLSGMLSMEVIWVPYAPQINGRVTA
jgi:hypothetical protein